MTYSRRDMGKLALAASSAAAANNTALAAAGKPNSKFGGVQIGAITYSFRGMPVENTLQYCVECGISGIEMMSDVAESFAGAPKPPRGAGGFGFGGPQRRQMTPEQQEAMRKAQEELKSWRLSLSMDKYKELRKTYRDAGVKIYAFKLPPTLSMSEKEYEYIWNAAQALGANHITMELPTEEELLKRVSGYAAERKLAIAFHTHGQGGPAVFDKAIASGKYAMVNFDIGHFVGVAGLDPLPMIVKYHDRIASLHLKDRKKPGGGNGGLQGPGGGGPNMPWGQGDTPLKEILQTMKKNKYQFPASIEYEYPTPQGSDILTEMKKCVEFCKAALA